MEVIFWPAVPADHLECGGCRWCSGLRCRPTTSNPVGWSALALEGAQQATEQAGEVGALVGTELGEQLVLVGEQVG